MISLSDKAGAVDFAKALAEFGVELLSTGGTAYLLREHGVPVKDVSAYTGSPEMMEGRLKTLHSKIHGGLLGRRPTDEPEMAEHGIEPIDLLAVNLYPFEETVQDPTCNLASAIEDIDIGGPAMLRAGAKNHDAVTVLVDPDDYARVVAEMRANRGAVGHALRYELAVKAFSHTARYDGVIANYLGALRPGRDRDLFPTTLSAQWTKAQTMRYGENPHQQAAFYLDRDIPDACVASARQLQGKVLSYNNVADTDAALECVKSFDAPACVIVKHANPCGAAVAEDIYEAYDRAYRTDPSSAFGGIIALNRALDKRTAEEILRRQFVEVVIAPAVTDDAIKVFETKKNVRLLVCGAWSEALPAGLDFKRVMGGLLVQERDVGEVAETATRIVTERAPTNREREDLWFAWKIAKFVKSNAIVYCKHGTTLGIGAGQMSRVYSARIAAMKAADEGLDVKDSVMASDAFFPFRDGVDAAAEIGVTAVIEPGGSVRDEEVIASANEHGMAMIFTGMRHFRH